MLISFLFQHIKSECTSTYAITDRPIIFSGNFEKDSIICINSSFNFLTVLFNEWSDSVATVYLRDSKQQIQTKGPYSSEDNIGGFDFGSNSGSVEITALKSNYISFAATIFSNSTLARVISNKAKDSFNLAKASSETLLITNNQHLEYFNGAPADQHYSVKLDSEEGDILEFIYNFSEDLDNQQYSGIMSFSSIVTTEKPVVLKWHTDREIVSGYIKIKIHSDYDPKKYIRYITDDHTFVIIPYLKKGLSTLYIILIVISCILVFVLSISLLILYFGKRKNKIKIEKGSEI